MDNDPMVHSEDQVAYSQLDQPLKHRKSKKSIGKVRVISGILLLAFVAVVATIAFLKWAPKRDSGKGVVEQTQETTDGLIFRAIFSTNYIWGNESGTPNIVNMEDISGELNDNLVETSLTITNIMLISSSQTNRQLRKLCEKRLPGYYLQMILFASSSHCDKYKDEKCKDQLQEELHNVFHDLSSMTINVRFEKNSSSVLPIKLCSLTEVENDDVEEIADIRQKSADIASVPKQGRVSVSDNNRAARCALCINRLDNVRMDGEYGTRIDDDFKLGLSFDDNRYRRERSVTVLEGNNYQINVRLDCGNAWSNPCSKSLSVTGWIDYNDNGIDDGESFVLRPAWVDRDKPSGEYVADIRAPMIDGRYAKSGIHMMRISVGASVDYQRDCGSIGYQESREYSVNLIAKLKPVVTTPAYIPPSPICYLPFPKIILVIMAGEKGTEIRDDIPRTRPISLYEDQHHQEVTLFENTVYLIRIQLDCSTQSNTELTRTGCNLAQDVFIAIDRNDDGRFDASELGTPYRWPVTSYMVEGIYDLQLYVPGLQDLYGRRETHKMRILVLPSDYYVRTCGSSLYNETREYQVKIIPFQRRTVISDVDRPSIKRDFQCSSDVSKILLVVMTGEYRTQIRDDPSTDVATANDPMHERHSAITLYEDTMYLLRIQLECRSNRDSQTARVNCSLPHDVRAWIDLNDDGVFDESENAAPYRWPIASYIPEGVYDLQIYVPSLDVYSVRSGPHTLRLQVTLDDEYKSRCGNNYYKETRDYNITIVRYKADPIDIGIPYLKLSEDVCSRENGKVVLILMTGELGTHIRDDTALKTVIPKTQNTHHMGVTLYDNAVYRIRIQLDCDQSSSRATYHQNCNLAQDVNVYIDFNNDGNFDESESRVPNRWPLHTSTGVGIYDLDIAVPTIGENYWRGGIHRMRIVVKSSSEYINRCNRNGYEESREYSVNIISRTLSQRGQ